MKVYSSTKTCRTTSHTSWRPFKQYVDSLPVHTCGGTGGWRCVVYFDMTDPSTTFPSGWQLTGHSKRTCGRVIIEMHTCDSAIFPVGGGEYTKVCGRIKSYQLGRPLAFFAYRRKKVITIDDSYICGVSVTHGAPSNHIWRMKKIQLGTRCVHVMLVLL